MTTPFNGEARLVSALHQLTPRAAEMQIAANDTAELAFPGERLASQIAYRATKCADFDR